mmetsp:Transcript_7893/g.19348  ORF Transcript_7893/g.19348 Transcript_7893/m.19348 type:complete len:229 (+) Transcript_7893:1332-2018(+)
MSMTCCSLSWSSTSVMRGQTNFSSGSSGMLNLTPPTRFFFPSFFSGIFTLDFFPFSSVTLKENAGVDFASSFFPSCSLKVPPLRIFAACSGDLMFFEVFTILKSISKPVLSFSARSITFFNRFSASSFLVASFARSCFICSSLRFRASSARAIFAFILSPYLFLRPPPFVPEGTTGDASLMSVEDFGVPFSTGVVLTDWETDCDSDRNPELLCLVSCLMPSSSSCGKA